MHFLDLNRNELEKHKRETGLHELYYKFRWNVLINLISCGTEFNENVT